jgi:hypothetical protein
LSVSGKKEMAKRCDVAHATAFLFDTLEGAAGETKATKGGLVVTRRDSKAGVTYSAGSAKQGSGMDGGFGGTVHSAAYAH